MPEKMVPITELGITVRNHGNTGINMETPAKTVEPLIYCQTRHNWPKRVMYVMSVAEETVDHYLKHRINSRNCRTTYIKYRTTGRNSKTTQSVYM
jgi:hypothetical protein